MDNYTTFNIDMVRGDTLSFGMEIEGLGQDLDSAYFTCRKSYEDEILFQKSLEDGISKVETGKYRVRVAPEDTESLTAGRYVYDLKIEANSDEFTVLWGILSIAPNVT